MNFLTDIDVFLIDEIIYVIYKSIKVSETHLCMKYSWHC